MYTYQNLGGQNLGDGTPAPDATDMSDGIPLWLVIIGLGFALVGIGTGWPFGSHR